MKIIVIEGVTRESAEINIKRINLNTGAYEGRRYSMHPASFSAKRLMKCMEACKWVDYVDGETIYNYKEQGDYPRDYTK